MKVPFGNMKIHYHAYKQELDQAVARVMESGHYILGPELDKFEADFAKFLGAKYTVGCASGTEAIYLALVACGVVPGDEVLVVAHTAVPTISAISMTGATPVFVDINASTYVMREIELEAKITPKTKVIVPVHIYGHMADMETIMKVAQKHGLKVMEDVAQATGATYRGQTAGTIGDYGAFSFYPSKNLGAFGDGGAISTNSEESYKKLIMLRNYGQSKRYYHDIIGINSRLDEIQCAILGAQLPFVHQWNDRRREIAARYTEGLKNVVVTPVEQQGCKHVYHLYVVQTPYRDELQQYLLDRGIQCLIHYPIPAHLQQAYAFLGYKTGDLPTTEHIVKRILSLPMFPELTDEQVDEVIEGIKDFHKERGITFEMVQNNKAFAEQTA
ncbi:MAG: DegT/DnrJ/EryC1/StrS family aminotransferase [Candidatus Obscuribacter sp.]|nr:DegT/DnrJ/EryC1/StrS family aminotransferase [Candidatus Obscuribacter sp.]MBP6594703.1 DegT/DnrJ/EryC1/StrS family aminotransferase [Candidatus Obscuribacter sp.]MBP7577788.1 DegT/DnrJ/EryC1/StrS family aminotransferase [Candidatus Obscuribacter sp.]